MKRKEKWFSFSYAKPKQWVKRHEQGIIKTSRYGGFMAGFAGGAIGALATRQPPIWLGGTVGGTLAGDVFGRRVVSSLEARLPSRTSFKIPKIRVSARQVITAPIAIPFKIGEYYGEAWVRHRKNVAAKQIAFIPARKNPFI